MNDQYDRQKTSERTYIELSRERGDIDRKGLHTEELRKVENVCHKTTHPVENINGP